MGRINRLPTDLANQIAAGEVVERPASVVKELVENAIDAGAKRIKIHVELGGKKLVRVEDDGEGMEPEDARLAIERHATSKIARADDLAAITTHGFRGEALPSIASVSHFVLRTRTRDRDSGTEIRVNAGLIAADVEAPAAVGTVVEVSDLFYNLPARRKFLKSDGAESAQVSRISTQLAFAYPDIGFTLTSGPRTLLQCPPAGSLRDRLYQLYGDREDLLEVHKSAGGITLFGFIAALAEQGPTRGPQNVFINRRIVKDRTIAHAIIDAYSVASIKERSPEVHLFLEMPADALDVNVHPTKAEVRFREPSLVHEVVRRGLMAVLGGRRRSGTAAAVGCRGVASVRARHSRRAGRRYLPESVGARRSAAFELSASPVSIPEFGCTPNPFIRTGGPQRGRDHWRDGAWRRTDSAGSGRRRCSRPGGGRRGSSAHSARAVPRHLHHCDRR